MAFMTQVTEFVISSMGLLYGSHSWAMKVCCSPALMVAASGLITMIDCRLVLACTWILLLVPVIVFLVSAAVMV